MRRLCHQLLRLCHPVAEALFFAKTKSTPSSRPKTGVRQKDPYIFRCYDLVSTPELQPNKSVEIIVGKCDHGPLVFNIQTNKPGPENKWNNFVSLFVFFLLEYTSRHWLNNCKAAPPAKSKMAARGPQNGQQGLPIGFFSVPVNFCSISFFI